MKQFASKLAPYLKPFIKKLTTNYIKKQLTTDDNMKEIQNNSSLLTKQLDFISNNEQLKAHRKVLLEKQEIEHKKNIRQAQLQESPLKGVIVGSFKEPLFLPFLHAKYTDLLQEKHSNINHTNTKSKTAQKSRKKLFQDHVDVLMNKGYDKTTGTKASNLRPDTQNQENQPYTGKTR